MEKEEYDLKEEVFQSIKNELHQKIDKEHEDQEKDNLQKERMIEAQSKEHLNLKQRVFGGSEKENQDKEKADAIKKKNRQKFMELQLADKKQRAEEFAEIQTFDKKWGRLEAREKAYGPDDPMVIELKEKKDFYDKQKLAERDDFRPSLGNEHKLITSKGQTKENFNDRAKDR